MTTGDAATESGEGGPAARQLARRASSFVGHPFVILMVGGLISVLLVPTLTRQWQDRQQRFDIQQELVADITRKSTTFVMALEFAYLGPEAAGKKALDKQYLGWQVESAVIAARLRAYYPAQPIAEEFERYSLAMLLVWSAHANNEPDAGYDDVVDTLRLHKSPHTSHSGDGAFIAVETEIFLARDRLVDRILSTPPRV